MPWESEQEKELIKEEIREKIRKKFENISTTDLIMLSELELATKILDEVEKI